jgi:hypothetical protein
MANGSCRQELVKLPDRRGCNELDMMFLLSIFAFEVLRDGSNCTQMSEAHGILTLS